METDRNDVSKRLRSDESPPINTPRTLMTRDFSCSFCTFETNNQVDLDFHNHVHHEHLCSQCLHVFPSYFLLDLHMNETHNTYSPIISYRCLFESCLKQFSNIEQRTQHLNNEHHTNDRYLNDIFSSFSNPQLFNTKISKNDKKFGCDSQKTFIRNTRLQPRQFLNTNWDNDE